MFSAQQYQQKDDMIWNQLEQVPLSKKDMLRDFPAFIRRRELPRLLAHYELFKEVVDLPGCILDLGVYRGSSFFTWAKLMETFCPGDRSRKVYGFDWFQGLRHFSEKDGAKHQKADKVVGGYTAEKDLVEMLVGLHNLDNLVPGIERCALIEGDVMKTIPQFVQEHPGLRISLLHLDLDMYEPTKFALEQLYPLVLKGGVIAFDEFALPPWEGETRAVEEFFMETTGEVPVIRKFPFSVQPCGYFVK